jgi:hypothetical protein
LRLAQEKLRLHTSTIPSARESLPMLDPAHDDLSRNAVANIAKAFGSDPEKTAAAARSVTSALTDNMARVASSRSGLADLVEIIGAPGRSAYLQPGVPLNNPQIEADGIGILSQILGSPDKSRAVAARAAKQSGLSPDLVKAMLPSIAAVVMGSLSTKTQAAFGDILKIPGLDEVAREARDEMGGGGQLAPPQYGSPLPLPGEPPRRYSPAPNPDWTGSTGRTGAQPAPQAPSPAPSGGSMRQQSPLPIPGEDVPGMGRHEDNPYGDLSDILRRGGFRLPGGFRVPGGQQQPRGGAARPSPRDYPDEGSAGGGGDLLGNIIRNVLGSVLGGGRGGGIVSWIIRFVILRYAAKFLPTILRRILGV